MNLVAYFAVLTCLSGPTCPKVPIVETDSYYSLADCEKSSRLVAQGIFVRSGDKYGFECKPVDYEPPNLGKKP